MKSLKNSPELVMILLGMFFISIIITVTVFYSPGVTVTKVIYPTDNVSVTAGETQQMESPNRQGGEISEKININTASAEMLAQINGIGDVKAQSIIDYRNKNGGFKTTGEIIRVKGIGEKTYENIKEQITV